MSTSRLTENWTDIAAQLLKIGATAYGGPAIMGVMQAELQEKRHWVSKERFVEGLSLVNMLPGATAAQLSIFLGYARGGWWGGLLGGLCFVLPGFLVLMALTMGYAALGVTPMLRGALYGLGPVVLGIYLVAVYRLGRAALSTRAQVVIAIAAAVAVSATPLGIVSILLLAGGVGLWLFHSRKLGVVVLVPLAAGLAVLHLVARSAPVPVALPAPAVADAPAAGLTQIALFLLKVGAFTFGGGLTMIAFIQDQVVSQWNWLTPQEFIDGLALGQLTPGPVLMVAAYVGYKVAGLAGAVIGGVAAFLPSFVMMLAILPAFDRARKLVWTRAALRGISPAVIGVLAVSLVRLAPHAVPDVFALVTLAATVVVLMVWRVGTIKVMLGGAVLGIARSRLLALPVTRSLLSTVTRS
jgi:chromate transporter